MRSEGDNTLVAHETVIVIPGCRPLHVATVNQRALSVRQVCESAPDPIGPDEVQLLSDYLARLDAWNATSFASSPEIPKTYEVRALLLLRGSLERLAHVSALGNAALTSLLAEPPPRPPRRAVVPHVAAKLAERVAAAPDPPLTPRQTRALLAIASDALMGETDDVTRDRLEAARAHEIPYGLSPSIRAGRLEEVISAVRVLVLLPMGEGAVEATTRLGQGDFVAAGEVALGGVALTVLLSAGTALAERALSWGQYRRTDDTSEP